jgi:vacuolar-type H+-ATPase subunit I/STV1
MIDENIKINIDWKQVHYKSIITNIEYFRDISLDNLNKETYEKINFAIKILIHFFEKNNYLEKNEEKALLSLKEYVINPTINNSDNIKEILKNIKEQLLPKNNNKVTDNWSHEIEIQVKDKVKEKVEWELPELINNLYIYFSKLFNRKRTLIEQNEIKSLKHLFELSEKYIINNEILFWNLILEQFQNLSKHINDLDIENNKQFKEKKIKTYFNNLIMILNEISNIYEKKK